MRAIDKYSCKQENLTLNPAEKLPIIGRFFKKKPRSEARVYRGIESVRRRAKPLFYVIRAFFRMVIRTQHREIQALGLENIPPDGSVLLVGNHPNSFLDYFNLLNVVRHPVGTAAKDTITNWFLLGPILRDHMLMVPISRKMDHADTSELSEEARRASNADSLREAVELLVKGRLLNIFVEGRSTDSRKLNKLKLGFMYIAIQAEKEFNFDLNLRIVPYGFYYSRINKFQSDVCVIFGRPIKLKDLTTIPEDFLALSEGDRTAIEKKIMVAGKQLISDAIEDIIISIDEKHLIDLIDDATALFTLTPMKYMGAYGNIREKYRLSKILADSFLAANRDESGQERLAHLKKMMSQYRKEVKSLGLRDAIIRREHTLAEMGYHLRVFLTGVLYSPLIVYGFVFNYLPRVAGRLMRYFVIEVQKRPRVDGDEQAMIAATITALITYPALGVLVYFGVKHYALAPLADFLRMVFVHGEVFAPADWITAGWTYISGTMGAVAVYLMARLWRFSLYHGQRLKDAIYWMGDFTIEVFRGPFVRQLRNHRSEIIDTIDFIIGDYDH